MKYHLQPRAPEGTVLVIIRGKPAAGVDPVPVALADWDFEFLWSRNATNVGITRYSRDGKSIHGDFNDRDQ